MQHGPALAKKALLENIQKFVDSKKDPTAHNLNVALLSIVHMLEDLQQEQRLTKQLLERVAGAVIR